MSNPLLLIRAPRRTGAFPCRTLYTSSVTFNSKAKSFKGLNITAQNWIRRQMKDPYVKRAKEENWRCRSAFKLLEIDDKHDIIKPGGIVIDCGAAPGSWSQVAVQRIRGSDESGRGLVIGVDLQYMNPVPGAVILSQCDFTSRDTLEQIRDILKERQADLVMSDMAPNATGHKDTDCEQISRLAASALRFSLSCLKQDGHFLGKIYEGEKKKAFRDLVARFFNTVKIIKPPSSRVDSAEVFILGKHFKGNK